MNTKAAAESAEHPVWAVWNRLVALFQVRTLLVTSFTSPGAKRFGGADYVGVLRRSRTTEAAFELMRPLDGGMFDAVSALAAVNARRQERLFRSTAVLYATIPVGLIALSGDIVPDAVLRMAAKQWLLLTFYGLLFTFVLLWYSASLWRARQILDVLDLVRIERDARPFTATELRED